MKKMMAAIITGVMLSTNVMATAPFSVVGSFPKVSFEDGENIKWYVGGENATHEIVTEVPGTLDGVVDGTKALKLNMNARTDNWGAITALTIQPKDGIPWNLGKTDIMKISLTNLDSFDSSIRINLFDATGNNRMVFFSVPANSTRQIEITPEYFGTAGEKTEKWSSDGFSGKGIDVSAMTSMRLHFPEPEPKFIPGQNRTSLIIDNIFVEKGPTAPTLPIEGSNFPTTSFEDGVAKTWNITGPFFTHEIVTEGAVDGTKALKVTLTERSMDWGKRTNLAIIPHNAVWNMGSATSIVATVTNPLDAAIQLRCNLFDTAGNTRMVYFSIPPKSTRELVFGPEQLGTPGVKNSKWSTDGYDSNGVDKSALKGMTFYMAEPELKTMPGVTSPVYIIDNITIR